MRPVIFSILITLEIAGTSAGLATSFRFAWLSDTHVFATTTGAEDLAMAVRTINQLDSIAFTIISGDITEMNIDDYLAQAKSILDDLKQPYYAIPGNHDTRWTDSGLIKFQQLWHQDKFTFEFNGYRFIGLHQGPELRMADGHFSPQDLRWLDSLLIALPGNKTPIVFITHYPIDASVDNSTVFYQIINKYPVQLLLHGHGHRNRVASLGHIPMVMGRSSLRRRADVGGFNMVEFARDSVYFYEFTSGCTTGQLWAKLAQHIYQDGPDVIFEQPVNVVNTQYPGIIEKWSVATGYTITAAPVLWQDLVLIGDTGGKIYGLSLNTGEIKWQFAVGASIYAPPAVADGKVIATSADSFVYCLDTSGRMLWCLHQEAPVLAAPVIEAGVVYVGSSDHHFRAVDLHSGQLCWHQDSIQGFVETRPLVYRDQVLFGAWDERLYSLSLTDGTLRWRWSDGKPGLLYSPAACWPVAANDNVFIVAPDRFITAIDHQNGQTRWRSNRFQVRESIGRSEDGSRIYVRCMQDTVVALDANAQNLKILWMRDCGYDYDIAPSMPIEKDGMLFFSTKNGLVLALAARTGALTWQHKIDNSLVNTVAPVDANRVVITNMNGRVVLLEKQHKNK